MPVDVMPILPASDFDEAAGFYRQLGFEVTGRWDDAYLILVHPLGIELHFFHATRRSLRDNDHGTYIRFPTADDATRLHDAWREALPAGGRLHDLQEMDYGLREFALHDPMGNLLRVGGLLS